MDASASDVQVTAFLVVFWSEIKQSFNFFIYLRWLKKRIKGEDLCAAPENRCRVVSLEKSRFKKIARISGS